MTVFIVAVIIQYAYVYTLSRRIKSLREELGRIKEMKIYIDSLEDYIKNNLLKGG